MAYRYRCEECGGRGRIPYASAPDEPGDECWNCNGSGYLIAPEDDMEAAMDDDDLDAMIDLDGGS